MDLISNIKKTYPMVSDVSVQNVAYALAEYLDLKKNMITQTMRMKNGYSVQCKGDATAEWTKYIGMDAALSIQLIQENDTLEVSIGFDKWMEKLGIAALGAIIFQPLLITSGIGALRQATLPSEIFSFVEEYLGVEPLSYTYDQQTDLFTRSKSEDVVVCEHCGTTNRVGAIFCKSCGESLAKEEIVCPSCGEVLDGDEAFCPRCGNKLID